MAAPLLKTKLYIPPPRPELVSRPRLIERLDEGVGLSVVGDDDGLVLLPGSGQVLGEHADRADPGAEGLSEQQRHEQYHQDQNRRRRMDAVQRALVDPGADFPTVLQPAHLANQAAIFSIPFNRFVQ